MTLNFLFPVEGRMWRGVLTMVLGLVLAACTKQAAVVRWPELKAMDEWAEKAEGWIEGGKIVEMRKALPEVVAAGKKLGAGGVPANAHEPKAVEQTLGDFRDVVKLLEKPGQSDEELKAQMGAMHPLVEKLMEQSGMPHVHDHDHGHEHEAK